MFGLNDLESGRKPPHLCRYPQLELIEQDWNSPKFSTLFFYAPPGPPQ